MNKIIQELDKWVSDKGDVSYLDDDVHVTPSTLENFKVTPTAAIQQSKKEIEEFVDILLELEPTNGALEIGLGFYGSTHFIWRLIFDKVITVEMNWDRIKEFGKNSKKYYGKWILDDDRSHFIHSKSYNPYAVESTRKILNGSKIDLLFIDGYHDYKNVLSEFLLYKDLVRPGGIIAFHDIQCKLHDRGVPHFIEDLEDGKIDGKRYKVNKIIHTEHLGIGWIEVG
ncbi:class I SAM-dependent methyltransferase [bacterium]|nr:class I SAM-dependent methyltransferase [bacterium]